MTIDDKRVLEGKAAHKRGWRIIPLNGKIPCIQGWQEPQEQTAEQAAAFAQQGNYGVVTGSDSGVVVLDVDNREAADRAISTLPPTVTVITGKGAHLYFKVPEGECPGNKVGLWPGVDFRGNRGQVVGAGSTHPETRALYRWEVGRAPGEVELAELPPAILEKVRPAPAPLRSLPGELPTPTTLAPNQSKYANRAIQEEIDAVLAAPEGTRNHALNRAAFSLGQLVGGGVLDEAMVANTLKGAAEQAGLNDFESWKTIKSGVKAGMAKPRAPEAYTGPKPVLTLTGPDGEVQYGVRPQEGADEPQEPAGPIEYHDLSDPAVDPSRPEFLVPSLVRAVGMHLVWAQPGGYKTRIMLKIILDLLTAGDGDCLLSHPEFLIRRKIERVLIVSTEEDAGELKYIMQTVAAGDGKAIPPDRIVHAYAHQPGRQNLTIEDLEQMIEDRGPFDMIFLDSLTGLRPRKPGVKWDVDNDAANDLCLALRRTIAIHKTSVWVIHHSDKLVQNYRGPTEWWAST
jgi:hypothetical protein